MLQQGIHAFKGKRILLLQGPAGPFFRRLSRDLTLAGARVFKVNFNGGDFFFYPRGAISFRGRADAWPVFFEDLLERLNIDIVLLFGDCRPLHRIACAIVQRRGLEIGVFEEGYLRPDYVTIERYGVNGFSQVPRSALFYLKLKKRKVEPPMHVGNTFWHTVSWVCLYYLAGILLKPLFRHYVHHRPLTLREVLPWLRSLWRKAYYAVKERNISARLTGTLAKRFYLVPLQVHNDSQIHTHSHFESVPHFIRHVVASFAHRAPRKTVLVIKHHPMDRAYSDYTPLVQELIETHALQGRCFYIHDQHLPSLLKRTRGVVVVNSTVGLSALYHGAPVKVCGNALYDIEGLTFRGPLGEFWRESHQSRPNHNLYDRFTNYLIQRTQLNGSFYKRLPNLGMETGLRWMNRKISSNAVMLKKASGHGKIDSSSPESAKILNKTL